MPDSTEARWGLAIDFGTTATAAATCDADGHIAPLAMAHGALAMPSSVFADEDELLVGQSADNQANLDLQCYEPTPKRRVGKQATLLGETPYEASQLIGAVLAAVLAEALKQHGHRAPSSVVLTHPVSWKSSRREVLADALNQTAAQLRLTLPEPIFVEEPVAAAHWFAKSAQSQDGDHFAVYDLGGGTFDAAVLARRGAEFEVLASGAIDELGGFEFDNLLFTYLGDSHIGPMDPQLWSRIVSANDASAWDDRRKMQERVKHLKEMLTDSPTKRIRLPGVTNQVVVTLGEFNNLIDKLIKKTVVELEATVARANLPLDQLSAIYRIGAAARTPLVGTMLDQLQVLVRTEDHPKLVVAQGGAIIAHRAMLALDEEPDDDEEGVDDRQEAPVDDVVSEEPSDSSERPPLWKDPNGLAGGLGAGVAVAGRFWSAQQKRLQKLRPGAASDSAFKTRLAQAGVDLERTCRSRLCVGSPQTSLNRTMVIQRAHLGIEGEFGVTADRRHRAPNVHAYAQVNAESYQKLGWLVYPPYLATVAGLPGGLEGWRSLHTPGQEARHVVQGYKQQGPYMFDTWFGEPHRSLREQVYIEAPAGTSQLTSRFASTLTTMIAVDGASDDRAAEQLAATVTMKGQTVELTAELSAVAAAPGSVAETVKAVMADRPGVSRILVNGEPAVFMTGSPCLVYRFEWEPAPNPGGPAGHAAVVTNWVWIGPIQGRVATISVESSNPATPAHQFRDLVHLG